MDEVLHGGTVSEACTSLVHSGARYLAEVSGGLFGRASEAELLAELRAREAIFRQQATADHALLAEIDRRGIAGRLSLPSTAALLQAMLQVSPHESKQRVTAAEVCGPRTSITGEQLTPLRPLIAQAQAAGALSVEQARVIGKVLHALPSTVAVADVTTAEQSLVDAAQSLRPYQLGQLGQRILAYLDPDGVLATDAEQQRRRRLALIPRSDGTYAISGELTSSCGAQLQAVLSAHAAPQPAEDGALDSRSYSQRMHDALEHLAGFEIRRGELPASGAGAQLIITMTAEQFYGRTGHAETSFGQLISVEQALQLADEASLTFLARQAKGAILNEHRDKRIATRAQSLALIARDRGCSFPDCDQPPEWTQRHHIQSWADGGNTDLDNLTLLCGPHHRSFEQQGWRCMVKDSLPWWIPPAWIDPARTPRQNQRISRQ